MVNGDLPAGWKWTTIGNIVTFEYGKGLTKEKRDQDGIFPVYGSNGIVGYHSIALIQEPCLIVGRKGAAGAVHKSVVPCWPIDTTYYVIPSKNINLSFLYYLFSNLDLSSLDRSTAIPGLNRNDAYAVNIPFPPLPEQERIVAKIEELFTQLEAGTAALRRVQAGLKRYKAAVLKAAVEGRLLDGGTRVKEGELPEGWRWVTVSQIGSKNEQTVLTGPFGSNLGREDFVSSGIPILTIGCLTEQGLDLTKAKYISKEKAKELDRYTVRKGDLLFSRMATVGRAGLVTNKHEGSIFNYHLMRLRLSSEVINPNYFLAYVRGAKIVINYVKEVNHGATRDGINTEQLLALPILLPPLHEQSCIVAEIDRRLSVAQRIETFVEQSLKRSARLRQAVLKAAFEGRLVKLNPGDAEQESLLVHTTSSEELNIEAKHKNPESQQLNIFND